jgi:hypothetical protein
MQQQQQQGEQGQGLDGRIADRVLWMVRGMSGVHSPHGVPGELERAAPGQAAYKGCVLRYDVACT